MTFSSTEPRLGRVKSKAGGCHFSSRRRSMRVAIYARVSTTSGQSPEMQLSDLREYASRRGWEVFAEYVDNGVSGAKESRPELNRLMAFRCSQAALRRRAVLED